MATTLGRLATRFRYAMQDFEAPYTIDPSDTLGLILTWINAAIEHINAEVHFVRKTGWLLPDGTNYKFNLGSGLVMKEKDYVYDPDVPINTDFMKLRKVHGKGRPITQHPLGLKFIRQLVSSSSGMLSGDPIHYVIQDKTIYLSSIMGAPVDSNEPTANEVIWIDYWATPTALAKAGIETLYNATAQPDYPLNNGFEQLIIDAMKEQAANDIGGDIKDKLLQELVNPPAGIKSYRELMNDFRNFVHEMGDDSNGPIYSDWGDDPAISSGVNDYTETDPWA